MEELETLDKGKMDFQTVTNTAETTHQSVKSEPQGRKQKTGVQDQKLEKKLQRQLQKKQIGTSLRGDWKKTMIGDIVIETPTKYK